MSVKMSPMPLATASIGTLLPVATMSPNARAAVAPPAAEQPVSFWHFAMSDVHASPCCYWASRHQAKRHQHAACRGRHYIFYSTASMARSCNVRTQYGDTADGNIGWGHAAAGLAGCPQVCERRGRRLEADHGGVRARDALRATQLDDLPPGSPVSALLYVCLAEAFMSLP